MKEDIKKRVVFCGVAWMKDYKGVTDYDKPINGGKYIKENTDGGEVYNFLPYNHKCYGYVMHYGDELHIERYDKVFKNHSEITDVTVVWVASDGDSSKIVGWYEYAIMYREWQYYWDASGAYHDYNFVADDKNCYLIAEKDRQFVIPRASVDGKGKGMGQSQVWYADSDYAQREFIPKVLIYLDSIREHCKPCYIATKQEFEKRAEDRGQTVNELMDLSAEAWEKGEHLEAFSYINLAVYKDDCFETRNRRADMFAQLEYLDEAEEEYKWAIYYKKDVNAMAALMYIEFQLEHVFLAISLGEEIRGRKNECDDWVNVAINLVLLYFDEKEWDKAEKIICECEEENFPNDWIEKARKYIKEYKNI